jgi:hypothetical protein
MIVDVAPARYVNRDCPGVVEHTTSGWRLAGVIDGVGSWGYGMEAADWVRRDLERRWAALKEPTPEAVVEEIEGSITRLPKDYTDAEEGYSFSVALVLVKGTTLTVVAAGANGVVRLTDTGSQAFFAPRRWIDSLVAEGHITLDVARAHPLRHCVVGPWVADEPRVPPAIFGPFETTDDSAIVVADVRVLSRLARIPPKKRRRMSAQSLQLLLQAPATPVVVLRP